MTYGSQPEEWKLQASVKVGPKNDRGEPLHMINVRAQNVDELNKQIDALSGSWGFLSNAMEQMGSSATSAPDLQAQAEAAIRNSFPEAEKVQTFGSKPSVPDCIHGPMKFFERTADKGKPFKAYFCQAPKGPNQCAPKFLD